MVNAVELCGDVNALGTVRGTLVAADAPAGLAQARDTAVIAHEEGAAGFPVAFAAGRGWDIAFVEAFVIVQEDTGMSMP